MREALDFAGIRGGFFQKKERNIRAKSLLRIFRLKEKKNRSIRNLSKGEQKKTLMAMELMAPSGNIFF